MRKPSNGSPRRYLGHWEKILRKIFCKRHQNRLGLYPTARSFRPKEMGILGLRMHRELRGIPQYDLNHSKTQKKESPPPEHSTKRTDDLETLKERVSTFAYKCSEKLRSKILLQIRDHVFIMTDRFKQDLKQYSNSITITLTNPSNSAIEISKSSTARTRKIYLPFFQYKSWGNGHRIRSRNRENDLII